MKDKLKPYHYLLITWLIVSLWGALLVFSASYIHAMTLGLSGFYYAIQHLAIIVLVLIGYFILTKVKRIPYVSLKLLITPLFYVTWICLLLVFFTGDVRGGAQSVITILGFDFQPLELYKIAMILFMAREFANPNRERTSKSLLRIAGIVGSGIFLIMIQPDLGGAAICFIIMYAMFLLNGEKAKELFIFMFVIIGILLIFLLVLIVGEGIGILPDYQLDRIETWLNPFQDPQGAGHNLINSLIAISNGGLSGSGFMNSIQKTGFLYASHTDFIFAIMFEEWGLKGAIFTIGGLFAISAQCIIIGNRAHERFGMLYCYGYGFLILIQSFINIGGVTGVIPMTGVTLPFISSGSNSLLFLSFGLLCVIIIDRETIRQEEKEQEKIKALNL